MKNLSTGSNAAIAGSGSGSGLERFDQNVATQRALNRVPPIELLALANTEDQKRWIGEISEHYSLIRSGLKAYFSGASLEYRDPKEKQRIQAEIHHLLSIYNLIWFGWDEIRSELKTLGNAAADEFPEQPGELLTLYLELECEGMAAACIFGGTISAYESRQILASGVSSSSTSPGAKKRSDRTMAYAAETLERAGNAALLLDFVERAVKKRLRGNSQLREHLSRFQKSRKERIRLTKQSLKGARGVKWDDGGFNLA